MKQMPNVRVWITLRSFLPWLLLPVKVSYGKSENLSKGRLTTVIVYIPTTARNHVMSTRKKSEFVIPAHETNATFSKNSEFCLLEIGEIVATLTTLKLNPPQDQG